MSNPGGNSLTLAGLETLGVTQNPEYRVGTGMEFGDIAPDTVSLSSLLLDGDVVSGSRTGNRQWQLIIVVTAASRLALSGFINTLTAAVSASGVKTFPIVWTPAGCPSTCFTAYRATVTVEKNLVKNDQLVAQVSLSFESRPFGQSLGSVQVASAAQGGGASLLVDGMDSGSFTNATLDTTTKYAGAGSCQVTAPQVGSSPYFQGPTVSRTVTAADISAMSSVTMRTRIQTDGTFAGTATVAIQLTLTSTPGNSAAYSTQVAYGISDLAWRLFSFDLNDPLSTTGTLDLTNITSWSAVVAIQSGFVGGGPGHVYTANLDVLTAYPPSSVGNTTAEGSVFTLPALVGSARTPVALAVSRAPTRQTSGNILTADDSSMEGSAGTWAPLLAAGNCTVAQTVAQALQGTHSLAMTASSAATMIARTVISGSMAAVSPGGIYTVRAAFRAATTGRAVVITVAWYDATNTFISAPIVASGNDVTTGWTTLTANLTAPANAAFASVRARVTTPANAEVHYVDAVGLLPGSNQAWVIGTGTYASTTKPTLTNLLLHSPPVGQDPDLTILAGLAAGTVTVPAANMNYDGTYSVAVAFSASAGVGISRVITVTVTQKISGVTVSTAAMTTTVIGTQTIAVIGEITLPLVAQPAENSNGSLTIAVSSSNGTDAFSDAALLDTQGQSVLLTGLAAPTTDVYVDLPDPTVGVGPVYASSTDRTGAYSAANLALISGGPILLEPGDNKILAMSTAGAPDLLATYTPAWLDEALV